MWEPFCIICGYGRMRTQDEWLGHMAGHSAERRMACDAIVPELDDLVAKIAPENRHPEI